MRLRVFRLLVIAFTMGVVFAGTKIVSAQVPPSLSSPRLRSPTISPWLDLFRRNEGVLDNYNQYVRPQLNLRRTLNQQQSEINRQRIGQRRLRSEVGALQRGGQGHTPTGVGASFQNYLHYYPSYQRTGPR